MGRVKQMEVEAVVVENGVQRKSALSEDDVFSDQPKLYFRVDEIPNVLQSFAFGVQEVLAMVAPILAVPLMMATAICVQDDDYETQTKLAATMLMIAGVAGFLQTTLGVRLPVIQGPTINFIIPTVALMSQPPFQCPSLDMLPSRNQNASAVEDTSLLYDAWKDRILMVQGGQIAAGLVQMLVGFAGVMGVLLKYIGPLTIVPTVTLIGLSLYEMINVMAETQWIVALMTVALFILFSIYLTKYEIPFPSVEKQEGRCSYSVKRSSLPVFNLFPFFLSMLAAWAICGILTAAGAFPEGSGGRTDTPAAAANIQNAPWVRVPYPGQWGVPRFDFALCLGMSFGAFASIIESIGDYCVTAAVSQCPPPPPHAINRGVAVEGFGVFIAGAFGSVGVTSYSQQVGLIAVTRVACRRATQFAAGMLCLLSIFPKIAAVFTSIPLAIIGGSLIIALGMVTSVALTNLQHVNLNLPRNVTILGLTIMTGLCLPLWMTHNPGAIQLGNVTVDRALTSLLSVPMIVGGIMGFVLDNTAPGSRRDRGLVTLHMQPTEESQTEELDDMDERSANDRSRKKLGPEVYDLPYITDWLQKFSCTRFLPFLPSRKSKNKKNRVNPETIKIDKV